jgi:hypothetical protein
MGGVIADATKISLLQSFAKYVFEHDYSLLFILIGIHETLRLVYRIKRWIGVWV